MIILLYRALLEMRTRARQGRILRPSSGICHNVIHGYQLLLDDGSVLSASFANEWFVKQFREMNLHHLFPVESMACDGNAFEYGLIYSYDDLKWDPTTINGRNRLKLLDMLIKIAEQEAGIC